jgi:hypothetical protein
MMDVSLRNKRSHPQRPPKGGAVRNEKPLAGPSLRIAMRTHGAHRVQETLERAMPIEPAQPQFPATESLRRFFRANRRGPVPLAELASLLGVSREAARAILDEEGGHPPDDRVAWREADALLFDAWPRTGIIDALGPELGGLIPAELRLIPVRWDLPIFVLRAMEYQAARAWYGDPRGRLGLVPAALHARGIDDYIADLLHAAIEPATLAAFGDDASFLRAFHYPMLD